MKNLPHEVMMTLLKHHYSEKPKVILNDLFKNFGNNLSEKLKCSQIKELLTILEEKKYIKWEVSIKFGDTDHYLADEGFKTDFRSDFGSEGKYALTDLKSLHILATLTPDGIDYAIDIDRKRVQDRNNNLAVIFAGVTIFLSIGSLFNTMITQRRLDNKVEQVQTALQTKDSLLKTAAYRLDSLIKALPIDSLKREE